MIVSCALCAARGQQVERLEREVLALRLQLANSEPTVSARLALEAVNARLVKSNRELERLRKQNRKAS